MSILDKPATETQETKIDPKLEVAGNSLLDMLMASAAINPWEKEWTGPRMAAVNDQQKQVMDATANAGNAFGFDFTSAANSLPQSTQINGMDAYDTLATAQAGIPPAMQELYSALFGASGPLAQYSVSNTTGDGASNTNTVTNNNNAYNAINPYWNGGLR